MIKKFTLLLLMVFIAMGSYAIDGIKTILIGETDLDWSTAVQIPKEHFSDAVSGDKLYFIASCDNVKLYIGNVSHESVSSPYTFTDEEIGKLKESGLLIQQNAKIYYAGFGPTLEYASPSDDILDGEIIGESFINWSEDIRNEIKLFDIIQFTIAPNTTGTGKFAVKHSEGSWETYYSIENVSEEMTIEWTISSLDALNYFKNNKIWIGDWSDLGSKNIKISSIKYKSLNTDNTILLEPSVKSYIQLSSIPSNSTIIYNRAFNWGWNTICLPFNINVSSIHASQATAYEFVAGNASTITMREITDGSLTAGVPYLVYVNTSDVSSATFSNVSVTAPTPSSTSEYGGLVFKGNYTAGADMNGKWGVAYMTDEWKIVKGKSGAKCKAFGAYFEGTPADPVAGSRGLSIVIGDGTTSIEKIQNIEEEKGDIYNLMGVKTTSVRKGIYIKNGKKYVVK